jgi:hypothetical protein
MALALLAPPARAQLEFGIPTPMASPINEGGGYAYPWLTSDELTMYFATTAGSLGGTDIMVATRASIDAPWGSPSNLGAPINTTLSDTFPSLTGDGLELYFQRTSDPFTHADGDLYVSKRASTSDPWESPVPLPLNSDVRDASPHISADGLTLYFDSTRPQSYVSYEFNTWVATRSSRSEPFGEPTYFHPGLGFVTEDGLTHLFSTGPEGASLLGVPNYGFDDLYARTRESTADDFGPARILDAPVSASSLDCCMALGVFDSKLLFTSARPGAPSDGPLGFVNMWQAPLAQAVTVEIQPGSDPALMNPMSEGVLPVAILSTEEFDASQVDPDTLLFGDPLLIAVGATPVSPLSWSQQDVDLDGLTDLALEFSIPELLANEVIGAATVQGYLAGGLLDGTVIAGRDGLTLVPEPSTLLLVAGLLAVTRCRRK